MASVIRIILTRHKTECMSERHTADGGCRMLATLIRHLPSVIRHPMQSSHSVLENLALFMPRRWRMTDDGWTLGIRHPPSGTRTQRGGMVLEARRAFT